MCKVTEHVAKSEAMSKFSGDLFQCGQSDVLGSVVGIEDGDVGGGPAARDDRLLLEVLEEEAEREVAAERLDVHLPTTDFSTCVMN